jgi:hypothetical protein
VQGLGLGLGLGLEGSSQTLFLPQEDWYKPTYYNKNGWYKIYIQNIILFIVLWGEVYDSLLTAYFVITCHEGSATE